MGRASAPGDGEQFVFGQHDKSGRLDAHCAVPLEALQFLIHPLPRGAEELRQVLLGQLQTDADLFALATP